MFLHMKEAMKTPWDTCILKQSLKKKIFLFHVIPENGHFLVIIVYALPIIRAESPKRINFLWLWRAFI